MKRRGSIHVRQSDFADRRACARRSMLAIRNSGIPVSLFWQEKQVGELLADIHLIAFPKDAVKIWPIV